MTERMAGERGGAAAARRARAAGARQPSVVAEQW
tara:strand:+ start:1431 stop:1532 length:102 start_codon:yes stop_codon:yes gene_type:complete